MPAYDSSSSSHRRDDRGSRSEDRRGSGDRGRGSATGNAPQARGGADGGSRRTVAERSSDSHGPSKKPEPDLPEHLTADLADRSVHRELRTLTKENAEGVARHLLAISEFLEAEDFDRALAHGETAVRRAGRVPIVREMLGVVHYRRGEWSKALSEFRTARRMSGSHHLLPLMADTERGLGRPEKAIELARGPEVATLKAEDRIELSLVVSGARLDLQQHGAAVEGLREALAVTKDSDTWAARVYYAYSEALAAKGDAEQADVWLRRAAKADAIGQTDAAERLAGPADADDGLQDLGEYWDLEGDEGTGQAGQR